MKLRTVAFWALLLLVASIPITNIVRIPGVGSLTRLIGFAALLLGVAGLFQRDSFTFRTPSFFIIITAIYTFFIALSYFWSQNVSATLSQIVTYAQLLIMVWLIWEYGRDTHARVMLMQAFVVGVFTALLIAANTLFGTDDYNFREFGDGFDANGLATVLALSMPMAWRLTLHWRRRWLVWLNTLYLPLAIFGVVMTASRGGLIVTLIALTIIPLTFPKLRTSRKLILITLITTAIWGIFFYFPQVFPNWQANLERLAGTSGEIQGGSWTGRLDIYEAGIELFWQHPYLGVGGGAFASAVEPILGRAIVAHNTFLSVVAEGGVVGLLLFLCILLSVTPSFLNVSAVARDFNGILFLALLVGIMPLSAEEAKFVWFVLALLASAESASVVQSRHALQPTPPLVSYSP